MNNVDRIKDNENQIDEYNIEIKKQYIVNVVRNVIVKPAELIIDLIMVPVRILNIVKKVNSIVDFYDFKQYSEREACALEMFFDPIMQAERLKEMEYSKEFIKSKIMRDDLKKLYDMQAFLFDKNIEIDDLKKMIEEKKI